MHRNSSRTRADQGAPALRVRRLNRWPLKRPLITAILALAITLAGCLGAAGDELESSAQDAPADETAPEELESFGEVFVVKSCPDPFLVILWPIDELQERLPDGFVAGDAADATVGFGTPHWLPARVDADATPLGMISVQVVLCEGDDDPRTHYQEVLTGIYIESPDVPDVHRAASLDIYVLEHAISTPWFVELMTPIGWDFRSDAVVEGVVDEGMAPSGTGRWTDASGMAYEIEMGAPPGSPALPFKDLVARYWQVVPEGLAYFDHLASGAAAYTPEFSCTTREDTALHELLGRTDCAHPDAEYFPFVIFGHDPTLSFHYLHGATVG